MSSYQYTAQELAERYQISSQQALRYITRLGSNRDELDSFLASSSRTPIHRDDEIDRSSLEVAFK
jgi:hypothetical protein